MLALLSDLRLQLADAASKLTAFLLLAGLEGVELSDLTQQGVDLTISPADFVAKLTRCGQRMRPRQADPRAPNEIEPDARAQQ